MASWTWHTTNGWSDSEWLDDLRWHDMVQDLFVAWDGLALFLGYSGSWWDMDGDLWVYIDVLPSGATTSPIGGPELPIGADWAVQVSEPDSALLWQWDGSAWSSQVWGDWAMGEATGQTEIRLPWSTLTGGSAGRLALLVAAHETDDAPGAVFPTTNARGGPWPDYYYWDDVQTASAPNDGQPQAIEATLSIQSDKAESTLCGPNEEVHYRITVENQEQRAVSGLRVDLEASAGLAYYDAIDPPGGASCVSCPDGVQEWNLTLPDIAAEASHTFTVTGRLAPSVLGLTAVTSTATLWAYPTPVVGEPLSDSVNNAVDGQPPTTQIDVEDGHPVPVGAWECTGTASDGEGIGVGQVEVRIQGGGWLTAGGTTAWSTSLTIPDAETVTIEARATDLFDQVGAPDVRQLAVDRTPPVISFTPPPVCARIERGDGGGTTSDPAPVSGKVERVEIQFDDPAKPWRTVTVLSAPDASRTQAWSYDWALPYEEGIVHQVRARATDLAGLQTVGSWGATLVDSVPPTITTTQLIDEVVITDYASPKNLQILIGEISDGIGVAGVEIRILAATGQVYTETADLAGNAWSYTPDVNTFASGSNRLRVVGTDVSGNVRIDGPYDLLVRRALPALTVNHTLESGRRQHGRDAGLCRRRSDLSDHRAQRRRRSRQERERQRRTAPIPPSHSIIHSRPRAAA